MAATNINQKPLYKQFLVGQNIYFTVNNDQEVATQTKVKFCMNVYVNSDSNSVGTSPAEYYGTFKTVPNNAGVGMWDLRSILENFVNPDHLLHIGAEYKETVYTGSKHQPPIHLVDKFSQSNNAVAYMRLIFFVEYLGADAAFPLIVSADTSTETNSTIYTFSDGYLKSTDLLSQGGTAQYNYLGNIYLRNFVNLPAGARSKPDFLTNAPLTQFANNDDYGTLAFLLNSKEFYAMSIGWYDEAGTVLGGLGLLRQANNGAFDVYSGHTSQRMMYFGCFPGNISNWSNTFITQVANGQLDGGYILVSPQGNNGQPCGVTRRININCPTKKGYEPIRVCWLNQYGAWDYFTFTKLSSRKLTTNGTTYTQLDGTWNERHNLVLGFRGGKKTFRVNTTEKIRVNTTYISEDFNVQMEELINSPEIYVLKGFRGDGRNDALNRYVTPVRLTTKDFTRKTVANDKLIQYEFELELSETQRTQAI